MKNYSIFEERILRPVLDSLNQRGEKKHHTDNGDFDGGDIIVRSDIHYLTQDGIQLMMDVYEPAEESEERFPVLIYIHGGALMLGDRKMSVGICGMLAQKGFIVCALDYRHVPDVRIFEQVSDVCAGMDFPLRYLDGTRADFHRIYIVAESAGAFLTVYALASAHSADLQEALGCIPPRVRPSAIAFISGMFYTARKDKVGLMANTYYGRDARAARMAPYKDPELPEIIDTLPPCLLMTSKADFLSRHTLDYHAALTAHGREAELLDMGSDRQLTHAFAAIHPDYPESAIAIDIITEWLKNH